MDFTVMCKKGILRSLLHCATEMDVKVFGEANRNSYVRIMLNVQL